jgi:ribosomal protein uL22
MKYSYNLDKKDVIFASASDLNASFKDLCAVCDSVRYKPLPAALQILDGVINEGRPIEFRRHNRYMGDRHELGGKKGRYPIKCAAMVRKVIINVSANARSKGEDPDSMFVVHAAANKTEEVPRSPPKGIRSIGGGYGYSSPRRSNLAFAKIEIGIANKDTKSLGTRMKRAIKSTSKSFKVVKVQAPTKKPQPKAQPKQPQQTKPLPPPTQDKTSIKEEKKREEARVEQSAKPEQNTKPNQTNE